MKREGALTFVLFFFLLVILIFFYMYKKNPTISNYDYSMATIRQQMREEGLTEEEIEKSTWIPANLPIYNHYQGKDGGYVAIYSHIEQGASYPVGKDIYVVGLLRVKGKFKKGEFYPVGYAPDAKEGMMHDAELKKIALQYLPEKWKAEDIWFGGDTSGFDEWATKFK